MDNGELSAGTGYAPRLYGLMRPYFMGLCTHVSWGYAPIVYGVTVSGLAKRPVFTTLSGLPPPEYLERTSM